MKWVGRRSNPRLRFFKPPLLRLSYRPNENGQAPGRLAVKVARDKASDTLAKRRNKGGRQVQDGINASSFIGGDLSNSVTGDCFCIH